MGLAKAEALTLLTGDGAGAAGLVCGGATGRAGNLFLSSAGTSEEGTVFETELDEDEDADEAFTPEDASRFGVGEAPEGTVAPEVAVLPADAVLPVDWRLFEVAVEVEDTVFLEETVVLEDGLEPEAGVPDGVEVVVVVVLEIVVVVSLSREQPTAHSKNESNVKI